MASPQTSTASGKSARPQPKHPVRATPPEQVSITVPERASHVEKAE